MKKVIVILIFLILAINKIGYTDFINIKNPLEGEYYFYGSSWGWGFSNKSFKSKVIFDLWKDENLPVYQYRYQLSNLSDSPGEAVRAIVINSEGKIQDQGVIQGSNYGPNKFRIRNNKAIYGWSPPLKSGLTSNWFWLTSYEEPKLSNAIIYGSKSIIYGFKWVSAKGPLPAPAPEPPVIFILGISFLLFLFFRKKIAQLS